MCTNIKPEITENNKYYIPKHRYYELLHFCRQYNDYKKKYKELEDVRVRAINYENDFPADNHADITADIAIHLGALNEKIHMIDDSAYEADPELSNYIIMAVTKGTSFVNLSTVYNIPCGKNTFYDRYRKFFWLLDKVRN